MKIMHIFMKIGGGEKNSGGRKTKLRKHIFALSSSYFLKKISHSLDYILFSSPNQETRNIYHKDDKVRLTFKSGTEV